MGIPQRFTTDEILDAAAEQVRVHGRTVTIQQIATAAGAPVGSIYYRFTSRDRLLAELWIRSIERFHDDYLSVAQLEGHLHAEEAQVILSRMATNLIAHVRSRPANAAAMTLFRQQVLVETVDDDLHDRVATINDRVYATLDVLCRARYVQPQERQRLLVRLAAIDLPLGLARPYVGGSLPPLLDEVAASAAIATLALGN